MQVLFIWYCVTQLMLYTGDKLSSPIFWCLCVCEASVTPDQISTFSNIYRHSSPLLTMYHLIASSTNLYWPSTSQYRHILTQYHQVPLIIHHLVRHSSVNWIISLFTTHLMSHAQYTWSSFHAVLSGMLSFLPVRVKSLDKLPNIASATIWQKHQQFYAFNYNFPFSDKFSSGCRRLKLSFYSAFASNYLNSITVTVARSNWLTLRKVKCKGNSDLLKCCWWQIWRWWQRYWWHGWA